MITDEMLAKIRERVVADEKLAEMIKHEAETQDTEDALNELRQCRKDDVLLETLERGILERLSEAEILAQMAEECAELGHAALKLRRVLDGSNPTPVTLREARENLQEEIEDVMGCMMLMGVQKGHDKRIEYKMRRWLSRLDGNRES